MTNVVKKAKGLILGFILAAVASFMLIQVPSAKADMMEFVKGLTTPATLDNYAARSNAWGDFNFEDSYFKVNGDYKVGMASQINNEPCGIGCEESHQLSFTTNIYLQEEEFEQVTVSGKMSLRAYDQGERLYFKIDDFTMNFMGVVTEDQQELDMINQELEKIKAQFFNRWVMLSTEDLLNEYGLNSEMSSLNSQEFNSAVLDIFENSMSKSGEEIMMELSTLVLDSLEVDGEVTAEEKEMVMEVLTTMMATELMREFDVQNGNNAGFTRLIMNRFSVVNMIDGVLQDVAGEQLSESDRKELTDVLDKMRFSLWYRYDEQQDDLMDIYLMYFGIEDLEGFNLNTFFRQQIWRVGETEVAAEPSDATNFEDFIQEIETYVSTGM